MTGSPTVRPAALKAGLDAQLAALEAMPPEQLKTEWVRVTASPLPRISLNLMRLALAWEIQAKALGGLSRATQHKLDQIAGGKTRTASPTAGTRLVREWGGKAHVVTIDEHKLIRWNDREWNSLSEVARAITGTRWSGPAFFGLKRKVAA
jgi:hypothetical protein